jgi:hypothetical protein
MIGNNKRTVRSWATGAEDEKRWPGWLLSIGDDELRFD